MFFGAGFINPLCQTVLVAPSDTSWRSLPYSSTGCFHPSTACPGIFLNYLWNHQQCCWFLYVDMQLWWDIPPIPSPRKVMPTETCFDDVGRIVRICAQVSNKSRTTPAWQLDHVNPAYSWKRHIMKIIIIKIMITIIIEIITVTIMIKITAMALSFNYGYHWRTGCPGLNHVYP